MYQSNLHTYYYYLQGNTITRIPSDSLPPSLTSISLINNPTRTIDNTAFAGSANTLEALTFAGFQFTRVPDALLCLNNLQTLTIYEATVLDWNLEVMTKLGQTVVRLYLEDVGLNTWPDWIQHFVHLQHLTLAGGTISYIPPGALGQMSNSLTDLNLNKNRLRKVPEAVCNFTSLQTLNFGNNTISDLTYLPKYSKLNALTLETNRISDAENLSNALLPFRDTLNYLYINENLLTSIPNLAFLTQVESLDFSKNKISNAYSGAVQSNLYSLDLRYNYLPALPHFMAHLINIRDVILTSNVIRNIIGEEFPPNTDTVDLSFNFITALTDTSFPENSKITVLQLSNNPLEIISPFAFKNIPLLLELYLQNTKLTRMPGTLAFLTSVSVVDFTNCNQLVCTCQERGLEPWIRSLFPSNVLGMCGVTSIYDFFTKLSSACP